MRYYKQQYNKQHGLADEWVDASTSMNRFRDNGELMYSLRSLEINAPWIRHIFIVTNGQIPSWLDVSNPKISIVTHKDIYYNSSVLPVFSSPSIELNLHHIHGLAEHFIYFNDDVFVGSPIMPYDLMTLQRGQMLFGSWEVPQCSDYCVTQKALSQIGRYSQLGDGKCDDKCNNEMCAFDFGDCANATRHGESDIYGHVGIAKMVDRSSSPLRPILHCNASVIQMKSNQVTTSDLHRLGQFLQDGWSVESDSVCVGRVWVGVDEDIIRVGIDEEGVWQISSAAVVESENVLWANWNATCREFDIVLKSELIEFAMDLHTVFAVQDSNGTSFLILIDVIRYGTEANPSLVRPFINTHTVTSPSLTIPLLLSMSNLGTTVFYANSIITTAALILSFSDPWPAADDDIMSGSFMSLSIVRYTVSNDAIIRDSSFVFSPDSGGWVFIKGDSVVTDPASVFSSKYNTYGLQTLRISPSSLTQPDGIDLEVAINVAESSHMSLTEFLQSREAIIGVKSDVKARVADMAWGRQMRTCREAFDLRFKSEGDLLSNTTVSFWRARHRFHTISSEHDEFWSIFVKSMDVDFYSSLTDLAGWDDYFSRIRDDPLVIAVPIVDFVSCSFDVTEQAFFESSEMRPRLVQSVFSTPAGNVYVLSRRAIGMITYREEVTTTRAGQIGAVLWFDMPTLMELVKRHSDMIRQQSYVTPTRTTVLPSEAVPMDVTDAAAPDYYRQHFNVSHLADAETVLLQYGNQSMQRRRLRDTYRSSLVFTNLQLIRMFGKMDRNVPAHMPHLIKKSVMFDIEQNLTYFVNSTIRHKFREDDDLQYAFLYFHYLHNLEMMKKEKWMEMIWRKEVDVDGDGFLNSNEFQTLAAMAYPDDLIDENKIQLLLCLAPNATALSQKYFGTSDGGALFSHDFYLVNITFDSFKICDIARCAVEQTFAFEAKFDIVSDSFVAFQMINDDVNDTIRQLNSVRARKSKFVCINDNIENTTMELNHEITAFYDSFFPNPSQFEKNKNTLITRLWVNASLIRLFFSEYLLNGVLIVLLLIIIGYIISFIEQHVKLIGRNTKECQVNNSIHSE